MEALPWPQLGIGSGWLLVCFFVWLMFTGRIKPKADIDRADHEANEWRTESRIKDQQLLEKDIQLRHLEEVGRSMEQVLRALSHVLEEGPP